MTLILLSVKESPGTAYPYRPRIEAGSRAACTHTLYIFTHDVFILMLSLCMGFLRVYEWGVDSPEASHSSNAGITSTASGTDMKNKAVCVCACMCVRECVRVCTYTLYVCVHHARERHTERARDKIFSSIWWMIAVWVSERNNPNVFPFTHASLSALCQNTTP